MRTNYITPKQKKEIICLMEEISLRFYTVNCEEEKLKKRAVDLFMNCIDDYIAFLEKENMVSKDMVESILTEIAWNVYVLELILITQPR